MLSAYVLCSSAPLFRCIPSQVLQLAGSRRRVARLRHYIDQCGNSKLSQLTADLSPLPLSPLVEYSSELRVYVWKH